MAQPAGRADEVLAQLEQASCDFQFPDLNHGYYYAVDARLHAFGDAARWALVVEAVGYNHRADNLIDVVHTFGNCLTNGAPGYENEDFHWNGASRGEVRSGVLRGGGTALRVSYLAEGIPACRITTLDELEVLAIAAVSHLI